MAEATGVFYAVETAIEGAIAAVKGIYDPTLPLRADLHPIKDVDLPRYGHTVSTVKGRVYVFGGIECDNEGKERLADNDVHVIVLPISATEGADYKRITAGTDAPSPRQGHSAAVIDDQIFIYGGATLEGQVVDDGGSIYAFSTTTSTWTRLKPASGDALPPARAHHASVATAHPRKPLKRSDVDVVPQMESDPATHVPEPDQPLTYGTVIVHGGVPDASDSSDEDPFGDVWSFDISTRVWAPLPSPSFPVRPARSPALAISGSRLYTYSAGQVQFMGLTSSSFNDKAGQGELGIAALGPWTPITKESHSAGPDERTGSSLFPITTGQGRQYLALVGGRVADAGEADGMKGDLWTLQLQPEGMTAASFKDAARMAIKKSTGENEWAEVRYFNSDGMMVQEGQPGRGIGPRHGFAAVTNSDEDGGTILIHGGKAHGKVRGDAMFVTFVI